MGRRHYRSWCRRNKDVQWNLQCETESRPLRNCSVLEVWKAGPSHEFPFESQLQASLDSRPAERNTSTWSHRHERLCQCRLLENPRMSPIGWNVGHGGSWRSPPQCDKARDTTAESQRQQFLDQWRLDSDKSPWASEWKWKSVRFISTTLLHNQS